MATTREQDEVTRANESGKQPVVFIHGLWLLPSSWDRWRSLFEEKGYTTLAPGWPGDAETVHEARTGANSLAGKSVGETAEYIEEVIDDLEKKPIIIGHSFGGTLTQILAGLGLASGAVAIDPAPFRGVLPLPKSALKAALPALKNPLNLAKTVMLTEEQWRFAFANAVTEEESKELYDTYAVPAPAKPLFQAALANLNPWSDVSVHTELRLRGPLLIISGENDNTVPWAIANASYKRYKRSRSPVEITEIPDRGHSLVIDSGWQEVAETALAFLDKHGLKP